MCCFSHCIDLNLVLGGEDIEILNNLLDKGSNFHFLHRSPKFSWSALVPGPSPVSSIGEQSTVFWKLDVFSPSGGKVGRRHASVGSITKS